MKVFLKMLLSAILVVISILFCDSLSIVLIMIVTLVYIWDEPENKKEGCKKE